MVLLIFSVIAIPAIFGHAQFTENYDEAKYHLPAIRQFAAELPHPNFETYSSATTPLYHLIFAILMRLGCGLITLRIINFAISVSIVLLVLLYLHRKSARRDSWLTYGATLLFASSIYVVGPSVRLTTDNLALLCAIGVLYLLDVEGQASSREFAAAVTLAIVAVLTRQLYLWLVPMLGIYGLTHHEWSAARRVMAVGGALLPLLAAIPLFLLWHGFTNSIFAPRHELQTAVVNGKAFALAICIIGAFALVFASSMIRALKPDARGMVIIALTLALALLRLPMLGAYAGSYRVPMEGGWLRSIAEHTPVIVHIWSLFWLLFPIGCAVIVAMIYRAAITTQDIWITIALLLWLAANIVQARAMAKYYEPFEIIVISRLAVTTSSTWWETLPVWAVTAMFVTVDIFRFWFGAGWASPGFGA